MDKLPARSGMHEVVRNTGNSRSRSSSGSGDRVRRIEHAIRCWERSGRDVDHDQVPTALSIMLAGPRRQAGGHA